MKTWLKYGLSGAVIGLIIGFLKETQFRKFASDFTNTGINPSPYIFLGYIIAFFLLFSAFGWLRGRSLSSKETISTKESLKQWANQNLIPIVLLILAASSAFYFNGKVRNSVLFLVSFIPISLIFIYYGIYAIIKRRLIPSSIFFRGIEWKDEVAKKFGIILLIFGIFLLIISVIFVIIIPIN